MQSLITGTVAAAAATALFAGGAAQAAPGGVLGPTGYKGLHLGQPEAEAEATGLVVNKESYQGCDYYDMHPDEGKQNPGNGVFISPDDGVQVIGGTTLSHTPEGLTFGKTRADVEQAYGELTPVPPFDWVVTTDVPNEDSGAKYRFAFDENNTISDFGLETADPASCVDPNR